ALTVNGTITATGAVDAPAHNISDKKITVTTFTSTGINAAIDALGSEGGEVYLPEGTYTIDSTITFDYDNTVLRGAGFGTYLDATSYNGHPILISGKSNCQVRDLYIKGSAGSGYTQNLITDGGVLSPYFVAYNIKLEDSDGMGISWTGAGASYGLLYNVNVDNSDTVGIYAVGGTYNKLTLCTASNCTGDGLYLSGEGSLIESCFSTLNGAIGLRGTAGNVIKSSTSLSNTGVGISCAGADNIVSGNIVSLSGGHGIQMIGARQLVTDNISSNNANGKVGIYLNGAPNSIVEGNHCTGAPGKEDWGIYLTNSDYCNIVGNYSTSHDNGGIHLDANS
ncbi:hypothetical protein LCGC14_3152380, partial [marine sediment metagenome]